MRRRLAWIKYGVVKGVRYKINTISWFFADVSLYSSIVLMYVLLSSIYSDFGIYSKTELGLYVSTYFLVNNIFAIFFSEAVSEYGNSILNGSYPYYQLNPLGTMRSFIVMNFNFPALLSFPILLAINLYFILSVHASILHIITYYFSIIVACVIMLFLFMTLTALLLFSIRSQALQAAVNQLFSIAERPDSVFHPAFKNFFTFVIPAFMLSAVPTRIALGISNLWDIVALCLSPIIFGGFYVLISIIGNKKNQNSGY